jgi:hypothetical protein
VSRTAHTAVRCCLLTEQMKSEYSSRISECLKCDCVALCMKVPSRPALSSSNFHLVPLLRLLYLCLVQRMAHLDFFRTTGGSKAATMACVRAKERIVQVRSKADSYHIFSLLTSSKTFLSPRCVKAEHSTYLTAPNSLANRSPASKLTGLCFCLASLSVTAGSSRKST